VAEQSQVGGGLEQPGVHLDLVDVGVVGLDLGHPGVSQEQVGGLGAAADPGLGQGVEGGVDGEHLGHGVHDQAGEHEALVGHAVGEADVGEQVGQGRVGAAGTGQAGSVVVAGDDH